MAIEPEQLQSRPWVDWCAGRIGDPVLRLRFLRAVSPREPALAKKTCPPLRYLALSLVPVLALVFVSVRGRSHAAASAAAPPRIAERSAPKESGTVPQVWQVETSANSETYSNGLRIDTRFVVKNHFRSYRLFPAVPDNRGPGIAGSKPLGIVFHTTESRQAPFEEQANGVLRRIGESLLEYVQRKRAYNFLIDRFGRVYRIVVESDSANHAGFSVWSDEQWLYVNLNESFLGVSFEAETKPEQIEAEVSPAQLHAAAVLTEMLRSRYGIAGSNCVTHAQVSVNPSNMRLGYHTDWASSFPFAALGLPDNYRQPEPALSAFGFEADPQFLRTAGPRLAASVNLAEEQLAERARIAGLSIRSYRERLRRLYRERLVELRRSTTEDSE
jgi:hypothetical protein